MRFLVTGHLGPLALFVAVWNTFLPPVIQSKANPSTHSVPSTRCESHKPSGTASVMVTTTTISRNMKNVEESATEVGWELTNPRDLRDPK